MSGYLQRLYDAAATSAAVTSAAVTSAQAPALRPAQYSRSPLVALDQRLASFPERYDIGTFPSAPAEPAAGELPAAPGEAARWPSGHTGRGLTRLGAEPGRAYEVRASTQAPATADGAPRDSARRQPADEAAARSPARPPPATPARTPLAPAIAPTGPASDPSDGATPAPGVPGVPAQSPEGSREPPERPNLRTAHGAASTPPLAAEPAPSPSANTTGAAADALAGQPPSTPPAAHRAQSRPEASLDEMTGKAEPQPAGRQVLRPPEQLPLPPLPPDPAERDREAIEERVTRLVREALAREGARLRPSRPGANGTAEGERPEAPQPPRPMTAATASVIGALERPRRQTTLFGVRLR